MEICTCNAVDSTTLRLEYGAEGRIKDHVPILMAVYVCFAVLIEIMMVLRYGYGKIQKIDIISTNLLGEIDAGISEVEERYRTTSFI